MQQTEMQGKICLVTGANGGIGKVTALELAKRGATVIMVCRDRTRGEAAQAEIKRISGNDAVDLLIADMSSLASVRQLSLAVHSRYSHLHVLINNAGGMITKRQVTSEGFERTFALNYLGPFLLTDLLLNLLKASAPARIVNVSSAAHTTGKINLSDLQSEKGYRGFSAYGTSKLELILFTRELAERLQGTGVTANSLHPGVVATSFFGGNKLIKAISGLVMLSPEQGALTSLYLATSPDVASVSGEYFAKSKVKQSSAASHDKALQKQLWQATEEILAEKSVAISSI